MHDLDVIDQKDRKVQQGSKKMLHFMRPEKIHQIARNYRVYE